MTVLYFVLAAAALGILVFIHELGHYFVAKKMGMTVETFGIGFGRPLVKWRWNDVDWQLGWIPFGGFVKIAGMEFGKKEKEKFKEPYEIPNGFFSKAPWRRICVALAGPFANFILAFLIFLAIWAIGGREKPFAEYTQIIGWVDPGSELYALGVRPGDVITEYNGKPFTSSKDHLYAAMLGGKEVSVSGFHVDESTGEKQPFSYEVETYPAATSIDGIMTTGITTGARYLIYDRLSDGSANPISAGSPMTNSGIEYGDRIVWADGEIIYSLDQLSHVVNQSQAFLTVQRGDDIFFTRQPRIFAHDLILPAHLKNELIDWQYEADLNGRWQDLKVLPYVVSSEGYIESPSQFIDQDSRLEAFPLHVYSTMLEEPLLPGDRIIAIDGKKVESGYDLLKNLQTHKVQMIVMKDVPLNHIVSSEEADQVFEKGLDVQSIQVFASKKNTHSSSTFALLDPVEPKRMDQFMLTAEAQERIKARFEQQKQEIEAIRDPKKRLQALEYLEESHQKLLLGIYFQDRQVAYNPGPFALFGSVFTETWQTLKSLVTGYLHPKWISGPIGIVQVIHHGWQLGIAEALFWIGAISVNLGFLNLLPVPVLDGGYVCLSLWEWVTGRRLKAKTMERLIIPFVVLLIGFLIFLTFQDLSRMF